MSWFDALLDMFGSDDRKPGDPELEFGFRGEGITYRSAGKELEIAFGYMKGARIYTETINAWNDGTPLSDEEKASVFASVLTFVKRNFRKSIVIINADDPSKALWERLCASHRGIIGDIEYTSDAEKTASMRSAFLPFAQMGKLVIDGTPVKDEKTLDRVLEELTKKRPGTKGE